VKTGDTDDNDAEQVDDWGSEKNRCGDKRILGSVVKTKTDRCRRGLWQQCTHIYCVNTIIYFGCN